MPDGEDGHSSCGTDPHESSLSGLLLGIDMVVKMEEEEESSADLLGDLSVSLLISFLSEPGRHLIGHLAGR